jgi:pyruvoyl-dependent arginine decarboxylase (PvlArgDC)
MFGSISEGVLDRTMNMTKSAVVGDEGDWTSVISAAVFLLD